MKNLNFILHLNEMIKFKIRVFCKSEKISIFELTYRKNGRFRDGI